MGFLSLPIRAPGICDPEAGGEVDSAQTLARCSLSSGPPGRRVHMVPGAWAPGARERWEAEGVGPTVVGGACVAKGIGGGQPPPKKNGCWQNMGRATGAG